MTKQTYRIRLTSTATDSHTFAWKEEGSRKQYKSASRTYTRARDALRGARRLLKTDKSMLIVTKA